MNFMLVCHIIFVLDVSEYVDTLFVSMVGMCLGIASAFIWLLRKSVLDAARATYARHWVKLYLPISQKFDSLCINYLF
jgi:hypothetical protein